MIITGQERHSTHWVYQIIDLLQKFVAIAIIVKGEYYSIWWQNVAFVTKHLFSTYAGNLIIYHCQPLPIINCQMRESASAIQYTSIDTRGSYVHIYVLFCWHRGFYQRGWILYKITSFASGQMTHFAFNPLILLLTDEEPVFIP